MSICAATRQASKNNKQLSDDAPFHEIYHHILYLAEKNKSIIIACVLKLKMKLKNAERWKYLEADEKCIFHEKKYE